MAEIWSGLRIDLIGLLAGLGAAACQATYFILIDKLTGAADPLVMTAAGSVVGAVVLTLIAAPWGTPWHVLVDSIAIGQRHAPGWVMAAWLILVSTVVAYLAGAAAVQRLSAPIAGAVAYVEVVAACVFALILLGETLRTNQIIGGVDRAGRRVRGPVVGGEGRVSGDPRRSPLRRTGSGHLSESTSSRGRPWVSCRYS